MMMMSCLLACVCMLTCECVNAFVCARVRVCMLTCECEYAYACEYMCVGAHPHARGPLCARLPHPYSTLKSHWFSFPAMLNPLSLSGSPRPASGSPCYDRGYNNRPAIPLLSAAFRRGNLPRAQINNNTHTQKIDCSLQNKTFFRMPSLD